MPVLKQSHREALTKRIVNFSKQRYVSEAWADEEWQKVWRSSWQAAAHITDFKQTGDFVVYDVGRESVLISRGEDGTVRAFYNVCQHRGLRLVDEHCGQSESFQCPYHSWRYSADGQLNHAPKPDGFQEGLPAQELGLAEIPCEVALGFVWVALDQEVEPLADYLQDMVPLMQHYEFENMTMTLDQTVSINCNWKAVVDNFSELYHVPYLHPQHRRFVDCTTATNELYPRGHTRVLVPGGTTDSLFSSPEQPTDILNLQLSALGLSPDDFDGRVDEVQAAIRVAKRQMAEGAEPYYRNFSDEELTDVIQTNVFPNTILSYTPEMLWLIRLRPHPTDPNRCYLDKLSFERFPVVDDRSVPESDEVDLRAFPRHATPAGKLGRPEHESFDYQDVIEGRKSMTDTIDQDLSLLSHAQQGMQSEGFQNLWLNEEECRISHFHEYLDECMAET